MFGLKNMGAEDWHETHRVEQKTTLEAVAPLSASSGLIRVNPLPHRCFSL